MKRFHTSIYILWPAVLIIFIQIGCANDRNENKKMTQQELVARGKYLVNFGGCNDCHSPKVMTNMGPVPDTTRLLSGHPENEPIIPVDTSFTSSKGIMSSMDLTVWAGPWGVSFPLNLTPDGETGLGNLTEDLFFRAMREGKHLGSGRPILPPMPWQSVGALKDEDLRAVYAYLKSLRPIRNRVPAPIPPNMVAHNSSANK